MNKYVVNYSFYIVASLMLVIMLSVSGHYGSVWDEGVQKEYGEKVYDYFATLGKDKSYENLTNLKYYGAIIELICAVANKLVDADEYDVRHFIIAILGFLGIFFTGLTAKKIGNNNTGILALIFLFFTPVFFGNSMYNSKDIPFACAYIMCVYFIVRIILESPKITKLTFIGTALSIAFCINIRVGGLILIFYSVLVSGILFFQYYRKSFENSDQNKQLIRSNLLKTLTCIIAGYFLGLLFWPFAISNPLTHPFEAYKVMSSFDQFDSINLFEGKWIHRWEVPWNYIPKWMWITVPLYINFGLFITPLYVYENRNSSKNIFVFAFLSFTILFPLAFVIINKSNVYDGWRHFYFIYPSLVVMLALSWQTIINSNLFKKFRWVVIFILLFFILEPALWMFRNHPQESFYCSPIAGGIKSAFKQFEIDYYGSSIRSAVEWIAEETKNSKNVRVRCWYGNKETTEHFVKQHNHLIYVQTSEESLEWDYSIVLPTQAKFDSTLLKNWPPPHTVYQTMVDSVPLVAVVKNYRLSDPNYFTAGNFKNVSDLNTLINASLTFYQKGKYFDCIEILERALVYWPDNTIALNNLCSAFNQLQLYDFAAEAGEKAVKIQPDYNLAIENLKFAKNNINRSIDLNQRADACINLSLIYYNLSLLEKSIRACELALSIRSNDVIALNNMCSVYNSMKQYDKATKACNRALKINPDFILAKNNLKVAYDHLRN